MSPQFDSFRRRTTAESTSDSNFSSEFIEKSTSSTTILHSRISKNVKAVLTRDHKEGADEVILFTYSQSNAAENVIVGDFILHDNINYLVFMDYILPQKIKTLYKKQRILQCNSIIKFNSFAQPATFIGSLKKFISTSTETEQVLTLALENYKPVVITKDSPLLKVNTRFMLGTETFVVTAIDRLSNPGIIYMSVNATNYNATTDDLNTGTANTPDAPIINEPDDDTLLQGQTVTVLTNGGYFWSDPVVEIINRNTTQISFICPFGIETLLIQTKDIDLNIVSKTYMVVI